MAKTRGSAQADRYQRLRHLGDGATGSVWLVEDSWHPGTRLALKELSGDLRGKESSLRREFATLSSLHHPNFVQVVDFDTDSVTGLPRFTMEYVDGPDLPGAVRAGGADAFLDLAAELLRALGFLHDFGLVHRDLKPANVLVRRQARLGARLALLDFGLARSFASVRDHASAAGTLPYMAPELFAGAVPGPRTDLYAAGVLLHEAVHGFPPFVQQQGASAADFIEAVRRGERRRSVWPERWPSALGPWLEELLSAAPEDRPAKASEALARLNQRCGTRYALETPETRRARLAFGSPPGRDDEVDKLWSYLQPSSGASIVWLCGGLGQGKTRILEWVGAQAIRTGWEVLRFSVSQIPDGSSQPSTARKTETPRLILIDQAEASTGGVAGMLQHVLEMAAGSTTRVVLAARPSEVTHVAVRDFLERAEATPSIRRVDLDRMDHDAVRAMIERATGASASRTRVRWLLDTSEGNPLIAESLIVSEAWELGRSEARSETLESAIERRLQKIRGDVRAFLEAACVLKADYPASVIASVADLDPGTGARLAGESLAAGLLRRVGENLTPDSRVLSRYVVGALAPSRRRELHRRAAHLLLSFDESRRDPWPIAAHLADSGQRERAVAFARQAAEMALGSEDPSTAPDRFAFAIRCLASRGDERRPGLRIGQAEALLAAGRNHEAVRAFGGAVASTVSRVERIRLRLRQGRALINAGRLARARGVIESAAGDAERAGDAALLAAARKLLGMVLLRSDRYEEAHEELHRAVTALRDTPDRAELAECLHFLAFTESRLGREAASRHFEEALEVYRRAEDRRGELKTLFSVGNHLKLQGRFDEAAELSERSKALAEELRDPTSLRLAISNLSGIAIQRGEYDKAVAYSREVESLATRFGQMTAALLSVNTTADALLYSGRPSAAAELLTRHLGKEAVQSLDSNMVSLVSVTLAEALMEAPSPDSRRIDRLLASAIRAFRARRDGPRTWRARGISLEWRLRQHALGRVSGLIRNLERAPENSSGVVGLESKTRFHIAKARYLVLTGDYRAAVEEAETTVGLAERGDQPMFGAVAHSVAAEAFEALGELDEVDRRRVAGRELLDMAASRIRDEEMRRDFLARPLFRGLREGAGRSKTDARLLALYEMIQVLNSETDVDRLLRSILDMALKVVRAERGMILLLDRESGEFTVRLARDLEEETERDAEAFSRSVIARAGAGESVLAIDTGEDERFRSLRSVSLFGIRSLMCVPLRLRGRIVGTVYLDSRSGAGIFSREDLKFVEAFADHAALALHNARERERLELENVRLRREAESRVRFENIVGESPAMQQVFSLMSKVAASELPVLIEGESGTGKELVAKAIHFHGRRRDRTFLTENCAAIPESLLESELFGHVRGAFTGAERDRAGLFEEADGGTLFLDEVGDMSPAMQARLLRVLQEGEIRRVGGNRPIKVDVRLIAASHRDLEERVRAGRFREDLLYRLKVLVVRIPPLRERMGDLRPLVDFLLARIAEERGRERPRIADEVLRRFERYSWPGNVRQLQNVLQRLSLMAGSNPIDLTLLEADRELGSLFDTARKTGEAIYSLAANERARIRSALEQAGGNRNEAARILGISRATIYRKIKEYGLR